MISPKFLSTAAALVIAGSAAVFFLQMPDRSAPGPTAQTAAAFVMPELSAEAVEGERYFNAVCAACHGQNGFGTDQGPPLIHDIYNPGHHADEAFFRAAGSGVPQHHWPFGNMPPQSLTQAEVARIVTFIREVQAANGITYRPHNM